MVELSRYEEEALVWVRRIQDPDFADWEAHADWLEADPRHLATFDRVSMLVEDATDGLAPAGRVPPVDRPEPVNDNPAPVPARRRWRGMAGFAVAAGIVGLVVAPQLHNTAPVVETIATQPGQTRDVALGDGTRIALNGDSRLRVDSADPRAVTLARGEAYFEVVHDAARPFVVHAGSGAIRDVGTAFDVALDGGAAEVAVHEGTVLAGRQDRTMQLDAGHAARIAADGSTTEIARVEPANVGGWRSGRLSFRDAALDRVARDLSRSLGEPVTLDPTLSGRRFTGVVVLGADHDRVMHRLAGVMGLAVARAGQGWRLSLAKQ